MVRAQLTPRLLIGLGVLHDVREGPAQHVRFFDPLAANGGWARTGRSRKRVADELRGLLDC